MSPKKRTVVDDSPDGNLTDEAAVERLLGEVKARESALVEELKARAAALENLAAVDEHAQAELLARMAREAEEFLASLPDASTLEEALASMRVDEAELQALFPKWEDVDFTWEPADLSFDTSLDLTFDRDELVHLQDTVPPAPKKTRRRTQSRRGTGGPQKNPDKPE